MQPNSQQFKIGIGTPMYGGFATVTYIQSLLKLVTTAPGQGIGIDPIFVFNESLITRARNRICDYFLKMTDCTHLLWVDADIEFNSADILSMLASGKDVIGAACVKKGLNWERIKQTIQRNGRELNEDALMSVSGDFVVQFMKPGEIDMGAPFEVKRLGTGLLLVKREVMLKHKKEFPDRYYNSAGDPAALPGPIHEFFESRIDPNTREYLSEDYAFCDDARRLGFSVWLAPWVKTTHMGSFKFHGDLAAVATATGSL